MTEIQHVPDGVYPSDVMSQAIPGELTETRYVLPADLGREEWERVGLILMRMGKSVQWWAGDWLTYGEMHYGEDAFAYLGKADKTFANWATTCRKIDPSRRREDVGYSVHAEVAPLEADDQVNILEEAAREGWTVSQTRERVREIQHEDAEREHGPSEVVIKQVCPTCGGNGEIVVEKEMEVLEVEEPQVELESDDLGGDAA